MIIPFGETVDTLKYVADFPQADGIRLLSIDYDANVYRFHLTLGEAESSQVFGVNSEEATEENAASDVLTEILSKE